MTAHHDRAIGAAVRAGLRAATVLLITIGCSTVDSMNGADAGTSDAARTDASVPVDGQVGDAGALDAPAVDASDVDAPGARPRRVLFIGNSYTHFNDLPSLVAAVTPTSADAPPIEVESVLVDGATLWDHWATTGARERVESGAFDVVVLQGQSTEPIRDARGGMTGFYFAAQYFIQAAVDHGEEVVFFVTWARRAGHPDYELLRLGDPTTMTRDLESGYWGGAGWLADQASYAHVGMAFQIALAELPEIDLYDADGSHPSAAGSFLAACVLSQMIGDEYARVPPAVPLGLDREQAEALCAIAPRVACTSGTYCHGACVRTANDPLNCGACDAVCPGDLPCTSGACACPYPEWSPCPGRYCAHLGLDTSNCGQCAHACETGQACRAGVCECTGTSQIWVSGGLAGLRAGCVRDSPTLETDCAAAIADYCGALGCFDTGIALTPFPAMAPNVLCFAGEPLASSFDALRALEPTCDGIDAAYGPACATAIHRACIASGAVSGAIATADATGVGMTCVRAGAVVRTTYTALAGALSFCDGTTTRSGAACTAASAGTCRAMGHAGGFGPVEAAGDDVDIVCVD